MTSFFRSMFKFNSNESNLYIYILPGHENQAEWEILDQEELERRVKQNALEEGCRLFRVDQELKVRFERKTHLE